MNHQFWARYRAALAEQEEMEEELDASRADPGDAQSKDSALQEAILALIDACPPGKSIDPADAARAVGGVHPDGWGPLMQPVRRIAVRLAKAGRIVILRKGKPADPDEFKGIYRLARAIEPPPSASLE